MHHTPVQWRNTTARLDLPIFTPAELERMIAEDNPLVVDAIREGVVLYSAA
jgi:hypothetical protein